VVGPSLSLEEIQGAITAECLDFLGDSWDEWYGRLVEYVSNAGHCLIPRDCQAEDGYRLGLWVGNQRANEESMSSERKRRLESVPGWVWDSLAEKWEIGFRYLTEFVAREGHCLVAGNYKTNDGYRLGQWVAAQRNRREVLLSVRINRLEAVPGWVWNAITEAWDIGFRHLNEFSEREGHCLIPGNHQTQDGYRLGQWVAVQRSAKADLPSDRKERLEAVNGWVWDVREAEWDMRFDDLKAHKSEHGNVDVPIKLESGLGMWVSVQRRAEKNGKLSPEKKARLNEIGFIWDTLDTQWADRLNELVAYKEKQGNLHVPQNYHSGLGSWLSQQKLYASKGRLSEERKTMLEQIGFSWDNRKPKSDWDHRFNELICYKEKQGSLEVPRSYPGGLGTWVGNQKSFLKKNQISDERRQKLIELGLEFESLESRWEAKFIELVGYKAMHGNLAVPISWETGLGSWVANQRAFAKSGRMSDERRARLDAIGFEW